MKVQAGKSVNAMVYEFISSIGKSHPESDQRPSDRMERLRLFERACHEQKVTSLIHNIYAAAVKKRLPDPGHVALVHQRTG
jgi:hypothetical protein